MSLIWLRFEHVLQTLASVLQTHLNSTHSPDISPSGFYLWGYLKNNVYQGRPQSIDDFNSVVFKLIQVVCNLFLFIVSCYVVVIKDCSFCLQAFAKFVLGEDQPQASENGTQHTDVQPAGCESGTQHKLKHRLIERCDSLSEEV